MCPYSVHRGAVLEFHIYVLYGYIRLMTGILHCLKEPKLWELWYIPDFGVMQNLYHQPWTIIDPWFQCLPRRQKAYNYRLPCPK